MDNGYILLHRKIRSSAIWHNSKLLHLFLHMLLDANYTEKKWHLDGHEYVIGRGQLVAGRKRLAGETGINENTIKDMVASLESLQLITSQSTNRFTLFTIVKYDEYQISEKKTPTVSPTKHQPATSQPPQRNTRIQKDNNFDKSKQRQFGNPNINTLLNYLQEKQGLDKLDESEGWNRRYAKLFLDRFENDVDICKQIIDIALKDSFYGSRLTSFRFLYINLGKLALKYKARGKSHIKIS